MKSFNTFYDSHNFTLLREFCMLHGTVRSFSKDEYFLHEGEYCKYMGLITKGYFKYTVADSDGLETVTGFAIADEFVTDFCGTIMKRPSETAIVAGTYSEAMIISA